MPGSNTFCGAIKWLVAAGVTTGYDDGGFRPAAPVSGQAIAALLYRMNGAINNAGVTDAACPAGTDTDGAGQTITNGYKDGSFHPRATTTRQAAAAFFYRFGNLQDTPGHDLWN